MTRIPLLDPRLSLFELFFTPRFRITCFLHDYISRGITKDRYIIVVR